jgi:hypothetical protein
MIDQNQLLLMALRQQQPQPQPQMQFAMNAKDPLGGPMDKPMLDAGGAGGPMPATPSGQFPQGYYEKIPQEMRLQRTGVSHPGFRWQVYDKQTGKAVGDPYSNASRARGRVDKLDNNYGAYRYGHKAVPASDMTEEEQNLLQKYGIDLGK